MNRHRTANFLLLAWPACNPARPDSSTLRRAPPPSALDRGTYRFGMLIVRFTDILVLFVLLINLLFHRTWLESFLFAVALAVGLTPELLPMIVSVTLARGAIRMAKAHVIVKRLGAIHDLRSVDVPRGLGRD